ncbi:unnamed protein product [Sphagnum jensenii]|uniref:Uncharacterized protein n=1 Tax=Sphagnum jensenii TaxID=128206 RepID=A0ABP1AMY9_9BRYO
MLGSIVVQWFVGNRVSDPERNFFYDLVGGGCFSPHVRFVQTFSVVGTGRAGVTGKWIGITKEVANNKRLIHVGTRRRTIPDVDADRNWSYK